jgi:hypothetical protein
MPDPPRDRNSMRSHPVQSAARSRETILTSGAARLRTHPRSAPVDVVALIKAERERRVFNDVYCEQIVRDVE